MHIWMDIWAPFVGEQLPLEREPANPHDRFAVTVDKDGLIIGHLPFNLAPIVSSFLTRSFNSGMAEVSGSNINRGGGYGLEIPCKYTFYRPKSYIDRIKACCDSLQENGLL